MKPYEEYEKAARPGAPFSNSTEWELFQFNVCMGQGNSDRRCVNDDDENCPLILLSLDEKWPAEWVGGKWGPTRCTEKTTPAEQRRAAKQVEDAAVEAEHYPMFPEVSS